MKGFVPTPCETVDAMVERLFQGRPPRPDDAVLDPGCGTGEFIDGVIRWCKRQGLTLPRYRRRVRSAPLTRVTREI